MPDDRAPGDVALARAFSEIITEGTRVWRDGYADSAQAAVWLVGLASAALVAVLANAEARRLLGHDLDLTVLLLLTSVLTGISYRLLGLWIAPRVHVHAIELIGAMKGFLAGASIINYPELSEAWTEAEIVERLKTHFDVDRSSLLSSGASLDDCRKSYQRVREITLKYETESVERLRAMLLAYTDQDEQRTPDLRQVRHRARKNRRIGHVGRALFFSCALSLAAGIVLVARAVLRA